MKAINVLRGFLSESPTGVYPDEVLGLVDAIERELEEEYVELPKDANGVPIRVGDWITGRRDAKAQVVAVTSDDVYWWEPDGCHWCLAFDVHHYHKPTVEDVLRKMLVQAVGYSDANTTVALNAIAEYAELLQLREDD